MTKDNPKIDILLASYNGERFIGQQIDSILSQTYTNWKLIIRDDKSSDRTPQIIKEYASKYSDKIRILDSNNRNLGVVKNFEELLKASDSNYICFCDQDDVWLPFKLEKTLEKMLKTEKLNPKKPVLVHTDMKVVNDKLIEINASFFKYQNIDPKLRTMGRALVQNTVTGCTVMINAKLKSLITPFSEKVVIHDWYSELVALEYGKVDYLDSQTVLYRQHNTNELGAKRYGLSYMFEQITKLFTKGNLLKGQVQASLLNDRIAKIYSTLNKQNWFKRRYYMFKYGFYKKGLLRNIGLFLKI
jgi:glycosyltransferase involved in cell wall biosynthesis